MKTTQTAVSLLAAAVLTLGACTVQVTPGVPGDGTQAPDDPAGASAAATAEPTPDPEAPLPDTLPALAAPDGTPIPYGPTLSNREAPASALSTEIVGEFASDPL